MARELEERLRVWHGVRSAVFHGAMDLVARDRAAAYFAESVDGAQVLIASEVGSEGRNFQFARHLVLYDLPDSPEVLEQRIGRLDRIGQLHTVNIHVPYVPGSREVRMLDWYHDGLNAFVAPCPVGERLHREFEERLDRCLADEDDDALRSIVTETAARREVLAAELEAGRDRLIELNSCRPLRAEELVTEASELERSTEFAAFLERLDRKSTRLNSSHSSVSRMPSSA